MNEIFTDVQHVYYFHVLISVLTASKSNTVTTEGVVKKKKPTNLMSARTKKKQLSKTLTEHLTLTFHKIVTG